MCKNAYEKISDRTEKTMIFCKLKGTESTLSNLCISQKYCGDKNRYVAINQKRDCKYFEE